MMKHWSMALRNCGWREEDRTRYTAIIANVWDTCVLDTCFKVINSFNKYNQRDCVWYILWLYDNTVYRKLCTAANEWCAARRVGET